MLKKCQNQNSQHKELQCCVLNSDKISHFVHCTAEEKQPKSAKNSFIERKAR